MLFRACREGGWLLAVVGVQDPHLCTRPHIHTLSNCRAGVLLDFPLPLALYRKILGQEVKLRDLEDMQPTLGRWEGCGWVGGRWCDATFLVGPAAAAVNAWMLRRR